VVCGRSLGKLGCLLWNGNYFFLAKK